MGINVGQVVRQWAIREPARTALVVFEPLRREVSFAELDERASRAAARLRGVGLGPGSRLALAAGNGLSFVDAWFGALYAGCTVLPIPPMSAVPEIAHRLLHARCAAIVTDGAMHALGEEARKGTGASLHLEASALADGPLDARGPLDVPAETVAMVLYTSGTTGTAKGATITHASLATHTAALVHHVLRLSPDDVVMATLPLTHSYGLRMTLLAPFYAGARSVLLDRFAAPRVLRVLGEEAVTWFPGVPTMFNALAHEPAAKASPHAALRWCMSAGAPLPDDVRLRAERTLGVPVRQGYGLTEATFTTVDLPSDPHGAGTVGRAVFGVEVRIVDEAGAEVPRGTAGEVTVRGQNVMAGYLDDPEATREALRGGWLHTGDVGVLDADGRLTVVDRLKDLVLRGGFNVYPAEVEAVLVSHPAVRDAVVVGLPDPHYGEEVVAVVVLRDHASVDLAELDAFCRARLSRTKVPRLYAEVAAMPIGPSGKVQRRVLRSAVHEGKLVLRHPPTSERAS